MSFGRSYPTSTDSRDSPIVATAARSSTTRTSGIATETTSLTSVTPGTGAAAVSATPMSAATNAAATTQTRVWYRTFEVASALVMTSCLPSPNPNPSAAPA